MMKKSGFMIMYLLAALLVLAACSGSGNGAGSQADQPAPVQQPNIEKEDREEQASEKIEEQPPEPMTLTIYAKTQLLDEDFETYIKAPLKEQFPHITIEKTDSQSSGSINDLIIAGQIPDIIWEGLTNIHDLVLLEVPKDLDPLVQKYDFDMERLEPGLEDSIRSYSPNSELIYMPFRAFSFALHYNKEIFDKFAVPYPHVGITWDEAIELGARVTREDQGIQYRGIHPGNSINRIQTQLSLPFVNPETNRSVVAETEDWRRLFQTFERMTSIPGNFPDGPNWGGVRNFYLEGTLAMYPHLILLGDADFIEAANNGLDWGITTYPTFSDLPGVGPGVFSDGFVIPNNSSNPDAAFQVIAYLLSDEVQALAARHGNQTSLRNSEIKKLLYETNPIVQGKDIDFDKILSIKYSDPGMRSVYDRNAMRIVDKHLKTYLRGESDMNTALRMADEEINQYVEAESK